MGELDVLKQRIEQADQRLRTAHSARERESAVLKEIWEQIRGRFAEQASELAKLRAEIADLEDIKNELLGMVRSLVAAVEDGVDHMRDETVPEIAAMASGLLGSAVASPVSAAPDPGLLPDGKEAATAEEMAEGSLDHVLEGPLEVDFPDPAGESLSPGIRDLINRVEGSFTNAVVGMPDDDDDDLTRDLREIEALRNELNGLRARMAADGR